MLGVHHLVEGLVRGLPEETVRSHIHIEQRVIPGVVVDDATAEILPSDGPPPAEGRDVDAVGLVPEQVVLGAEVGDDSPSTVGEVENAVVGSGFTQHGPEVVGKLNNGVGVGRTTDELIARLRRVLNPVARGGVVEGPHLATEQRRQVGGDAAPVLVRVVDAVDEAHVDARSPRSRSCCVVRRCIRPRPADEGEGRVQGSAGRPAEEQEQHESGDVSLFHISLINNSLPKLENTGPSTFRISRYALYAADSIYSVIPLVLQRILLSRVFKKILRTGPRPRS